MGALWVLGGPNTTVLRACLKKGKRGTVLSQMWVRGPVNPLLISVLRLKSMNAPQSFQMAFL